MELPLQAPTRPYSRPQVLLHWAVALLIVVQWLSADAMEDFFDRFDDTPPGFPDGPAVVHALGGMTILLLMVLRVAARIRYGAPALPADVSWPIRVAARLDHLALYLVLFALPLSGLAALFISTEAGDAHEAAKTILLLLVALHIAGAAFHAFVRRDGVIWRMLSLRG